MEVAQPLVVEEDALPRGHFPFLHVSSRERMNCEGEIGDDEVALLKAHVDLLLSFLPRKTRFKTGTSF